MLSLKWNKYITREFWMSQEVKMNAEEKVAKNVVSKHWNYPVKSLLASDLTDYKDWFYCHKVIHVADSDFKKWRSVIVTITGEGDVTVFDGTENVKRINRFFEIENIAFPFGIPTGNLCNFIHGFCSGTFRGCVASSEFLAHEEKGIHYWAPTEQLQLLFREYCKDPSIIRYGDRSWDLVFYLFSEFGSLQKWKTEGDITSIKKIKSEVLFPNGTFRFPFIG